LVPLGREAGKPVINYLPIILNEPLMMSSPDSRISKLFLTFVTPDRRQTGLIPWFIASDQKKTIPFMSLMLITTVWSIRDRVLRVKGILAGDFA